MNCQLSKKKKKKKKKKKIRSENLNKSYIKISSAVDSSENWVSDNIKVKEILV